MSRSTRQCLHLPDLVELLAVRLPRVEIDEPAAGQLHEVVDPPAAKVVLTARRIASERLTPGSARINSVTKSSSITMVVRITLPSMSEHKSSFK